MSEEKSGAPGGLKIIISYDVFTGEKGVIRMAKQNIYDNEEYFAYFLKNRDNEMSGSAKGVTAAKAKGRKYLRNRGYGKKTTTASQSTVKGIFSQPLRVSSSSSRSHGRTSP